MVLIDAVNDGINEGCDVHEDSNGGVNWFDWDTTLAPSNDNTYAATSPWTWSSTHGTHGTHDDHGNTELDWASTMGGYGNSGSTPAGWTWGSVSTWASTTAGAVSAWSWPSTTGNGYAGPTGTWGSTPAPWTWPPGWTGSTPKPGDTWDPASWAWPPGWTGSTPNPLATWTPIDMDDLQSKLDEANSLTQEQLDQLDQTMDNANDLANQMAGDANDLASQLNGISSDTMNDANDLANNLNNDMANLFGKKRKKRGTDDLCVQHEDNQVCI